MEGVGGASLKALGQKRGMGTGGRGCGVQGAGRGGRPGQAEGVGGAGRRRSCPGGLAPRDHWWRGRGTRARRRWDSEGGRAQIREPRRRPGGRLHPDPGAEDTGLGWKDGSSLRAVLSTVPALRRPLPECPSSLPPNAAAHCGVNPVGDPDSFWHVGVMSARKCGSSPKTLRGERAAPACWRSSRRRAGGERTCWGVMEASLNFPYS